MSIKDIVLITDAGRSCAAGAGWAAGMAQAFGADLLGLCRVPMPEPTTPECFAIGASAVASVIIEMDARTEAALAKSRKGFQEAATACVNKVGWRETLVGEAAETIARGVRCFDLAVVLDYGAESRRLAELVTLLSGTPCVLLPEAMPAWKPFERVMVGWDGSREARRALDAALPFLRQAKEVRLVSIRAGTTPAVEMDPDWGVVAHLRRHDVEAELHLAAGAATDIGSALIDQATVFGADLVAIGAYGHSRTAELVFGGATQTLLEREAAPLLMAH